MIPLHCSAEATCPQLGVTRRLRWFFTAIAHAFFCPPAPSCLPRVLMSGVHQIGLAASRSAGVSRGFHIGRGIPAAAALCGIVQGVGEAQVVELAPAVGHLCGVSHGFPEGYARSCAACWQSIVSTVPHIRRVEITSFSVVVLATSCTLFARRQSASKRSTARGSGVEQVAAAR